MVSVAALALIAGTGLANAQGGMKNESGGSAMQHSSSPSSGSSMGKSDSTVGQSSTESPESSRDSTKGGTKASQSEKSPGAMKNQNAQETPKSGNTNQRAEERNKGAETNQRAEERNKGTETNQRAEERNKGTETNQRAEERNKSGTNAAETKSSSQSTVGQAAGGAKLTSDQRTKITTIIRDEHAAPVNSVNFSIAVGTRVPREGVSFRPLPAQVITIYPEWRGYEYILVRNQILVIDPNTYEIVAILEA
jgi:hypothetical protein